MLGAIPGTTPLPRYAPQFAAILFDSGSWSLVGELFPLALGISAIVSLRSMLVCTAGETLTNERYNSNKELIGQGIGNMLAGVFGGVTCAGSMPSTLSTYKFGGRTPLCRVASGVFPLMVLVVLHPLVAMIPKVVLAAMLIMIALTSFDKWSIGIVKNLAATLKERDFDLVVNLVLVIVVSLVVIIFGIFQALGVGALVSVFWLIQRMSKSIIRQELTAQNIRSNTYRSEKENHALDEHGARIRILELEGTLFFGTADKISERIDTLLKQHVEWIILEFSRVGEIDSTGAKITSQLLGKCASQGATMYLAGLKSGDDAHHHRQLRSNLGPDQEHLCFADREEAMDEAEEHLLDQVLGEGRYDSEIELGEVGILEAMSPQQLEVLRPYLEKKCYVDKEFVFRQGDLGDSIYLVVKGRARIILVLPGGHQKRLRTLCPGTVIGEMAILNTAPRSADVLAQGELTCYRMSQEDLNRLTTEDAEVGICIITGIAQELSIRLRISSQLLASM